MKRNFYLPTNFTNNAERCQNIELVKIRATYKVAIISTLCYSCIFVKLVGHKNQRVNTAWEAVQNTAIVTEDFVVGY